MAQPLRHAALGTAQLVGGTGHPRSRTHASPLFTGVGLVAAHPTGTTVRLVAVQLCLTATFFVAVTVAFQTTAAAKQAQLVEFTGIRTLAAVLWVLGGVGAGLQVFVELTTRLFDRTDLALPTLTALITGWETQTLATQLSACTTDAVAAGAALCTGQAAGTCAGPLFAALTWVAGDTTGSAGLAGAQQVDAAHSRTTGLEAHFTGSGLHAWRGFADAAPLQAELVEATAHTTSSAVARISQHLSALPITTPLLCFAAASLLVELCVLRVVELLAVSFVLAETIDAAFRCRAVLIAAAALLLDRLNAEGAEYEEEGERCGPHPSTGIERRVPSPCHLHSSAKQAKVCKLHASRHE
jgi:hypothetical protein